MERHKRVSRQGAKLAKDRTKNVPKWVPEKRLGTVPGFQAVGLFSISGLNPGPLIDADGTAQNTGVLYVPVWYR